MKKQFWLEDWECDLIHRSLTHIATQSSRRAEASNAPIDRLCMHWTRDQAKVLAEKFASVKP